MEKIFGLANWKTDDRVANAKRKVDVEIVFLYPEINTLLHVKPKKRSAAIEDVFKEHFQICFRSSCSTGLRL